MLARRAASRLVRCSHLASPDPTTLHIRSFASPTHERRHSEKRIVPFSREQLFDVVADVDRYHEFVPWCTASRVVKRVDDKHMVADLCVGFRLLSESYSSVITLERPRSIKVDVPKSNLFDYLINDWEFDETTNGTLLSFQLRFAFRNPLYQQASNLFFEDVVKQMVSAFENRCHLLHGSSRRPGRFERKDTNQDDDDSPRRPSRDEIHRW